MTENKKEQKNKTQKNKILNKDKTIEVTGIGNAIIDIVASVDDDFLLKHNLDKGSMKLICEVEALDLHSKLNIKKMISGGSAANTIAGMAYLGDKVAFIGKVKNDKFGLEFEKDLKKLGVIFKTKKAQGNCPSTACCIVLTTPDAQRTMNTFLGISCMLSEKDIDEKIISNSKIVYIEGYLFDQETAKNAVFKAIDLSFKYNCITAISMSDNFCVQRNLDIFKELIFNNKINICFGNEDEINQFFKTKSVDDAILEIKKLNVETIFVITLGFKGSVVCVKDNTFFVEAHKVDTVDTTGAGDLYASGFLHGYVNNRDLYSCAKIGSLVAAQIVSQYGARPQKSLLELLSQHNI